MLDGYKQLLPQQVTDANMVKEHERAIKDILLAYGGREASLAVTNVEQASMWAVKAITK